MKDDDNLYPNSGEGNEPYYPEEQTQSDDKQALEKAKITKSYPVLDDIVEWFDKEVELCRDISNVEVKSIVVNGTKFSTKISVEGQVLAFQLLKEKFEERRNYYKKWKNKKDGSS